MHSTGSFPLDREILVDVARLEWAHIEAFDGADEPALSLEQTQSLTATSRLAIQPHVQLIRGGFPIDKFVVSVHRAQDEPEMASNAVRNRRRVP